MRKNVTLALATVFGSLGSETFTHNLIWGLDKTRRLNVARETFCGSNY